jgi:hypothetical protein
LLLEEGIKLLEAEESEGLYGYMRFLVMVDIDQSREGRLTYWVRMQLAQEVLLARDPSIKIEAVTWGGGDPITGYSRCGSRDEAQALEMLIEEIIRSHIEGRVHDLATSYQVDNEPDHLKPEERGGKYDTGPLDEQ